MQQDERLHGVYARLVAQLRPEVPCQDDTPCDETEHYADLEQGERRHLGLLPQVRRTGCIEDQLRSTNQKSFLGSRLRFVTTITGWIFLPVGCFFRQSKLV